MLAVAERDILEGSVDELTLHPLALNLTHPGEAEWIEGIRILVD